MIMYCNKCGAPVGDRDAFCSKCGYSQPKYENTGAYTNQMPNNQPQPAPQTTEFSEKNGLVALVLAVFVGYLGIHSFYTGRIGIGIAQLFTAGGCGIWVLVDIILLATGSLKDGEGKIIKLD